MKALTCSTGGARREAAPAAVFGEIDATVRRSIARAKPRRLSSIATGAVSSILALVFLAALVPMARAAPEERDDEGTGSSRADQLTTPQTIAIWLRRIARQCSEQRT
jgi:hypothetical protein